MACLTAGQIIFLEVGFVDSEIKGIRFPPQMGTVLLAAINHSGCRVCYTVAND
jgi:hypothetical protein